MLSGTCDSKKAREHQNSANNTVSLKDGARHKLMVAADSTSAYCI